jgi:hypothetical protein
MAKSGTYLSVDKYPVPGGFCATLCERGRTLYSSSLDTSYEMVRYYEVQQTEDRNM